MNWEDDQIPQTVEEIFKDIEGRRHGIIKALTSDFDEFHRQCDPKTPNLCLYGSPNQQWQVHSPSSEIPEPKSGINFIRDNMNLKEWLSMVALHSDAWLLALASYFGAKSGFDSVKRKRLFSMISNLQTIHEVVRGEKPKRKQPTKKIAKKEDTFPAELWTEVFSRVPVKSLMKFRCVCKTFCSIIDDPKFVSMHLSAYKDHSEACLLFVADRPLYWKYKELFVLRRSDTFRRVVELDFPIGDGETCDVVGCINGVVLVHKKYYVSESMMDSVAVLWNPSIRKIYEVPSFPFSSICKRKKTIHRDANFNLGNDISKYLELGFGFGDSQCDPVIVAIFYPSVVEVESYFATARLYLTHYRANIAGSVEVYSYGLDSWRSFDIHTPSWWRGGPQAFINQAIHWLGVWDEEDPDSMISGVDSFIISFDICEKVFHYIELPELSDGPGDDDYRDKVIPTIVNEKLALFDVYENNVCIVWVMEEYGLPGSWVKRYVFKVAFDRFLYFKDAEFLFAVEGEGVKLYDIENEVTKDLAKTTYRKCSKYKVCAYRESLLLSDVAELEEDSDSA